MFFDGQISSLFRDKNPQLSIVTGIDDRQARREVFRRQIRPGLETQVATYSLGATMLGEPDRAIRDDVKGGSP